MSHNDDVLLNEYNTNGLTIKDFKLGLNLALKTFFISSILLFLLLVYFIYFSNENFLTSVVLYLSTKIMFSVPLTITIIAVLFGILLAKRVFSVNGKLRIVDGYLIIPETDVANNIIDFITMKPLTGYFFYKFIPVVDIVDIKLDGHGDQNLKNFPLTVTDFIESNQLDFSSRQKRDEFGFKLSSVTGKKYEQTAQMGASQ